MKIGIIGAMDLEIETLTKTEMQSEDIISRAGLRFHVGKLGGVDVVIVKSGVGKVNAAICAQLLIDCFGVTHLLNTGIAGSLDHNINIGDIVVSTDAMQHDMDLTALGFEPGVIPQLGSSGFLKEFTADPSLRAAAVSICREFIPEINVFEGRIVSGDQFICTADQRHRLADSFHALCTEMEGAAIAHTAYVNGVPFVILRAISDKADEEADTAFDTFQQQAAANCAKLVTHLVRNLSQKPPR
ncbi:MAG: 5'-methylthioadenosine/adenosylhomocysteine nucleosidase [Eubacteriales bacterium]|nr:5'-methylthioadenosine/adenosylhomocysteine nucleosidase [Eubacteriales bacterium]